jgi:L-ascorbate metabolism protein UlaG (beta-lactamase superfamily)
MSPLMRRAIFSFGITAALLGLAVGGGVAGEPTGAGVKMEWLSWSHFRFTSPNGKVLLTNPWVTNRDSPIKVEDVSKADIIVVADGHGDEIGQAPEIAMKTGAKIVAVRELANGYLKTVAKVPEKQLVMAGIGDLYDFDGIKVRVVHSIHGSSVPDPSAPYGGPAAGFIMTFENGFTVYFAGSTAIHSDMALYATLYKPHMAILPLSSNRDPKDFAEMVRLLLTNNPSLKTVLPHHHSVKPQPGRPSPQDAEAAVKTLGLPVEFLNPVLQRSYTFPK